MWVTICPHGLGRKAKGCKDLVPIELAAAARLTCIEKEFDDCVLCLWISNSDSPKQVRISFPMVNYLYLLLGKETGRGSS